MIIDRIRQDMSVIAIDDRCVGFVSGLEDDEALRITSVSAGYGYDRLIPLSWVSAVDKYVYLDKTTPYVTAHWQNAEFTSGAMRGAGAGTIARPKAKAA